MADFLNAECGQVNPVLKVASHFTNDLSLRENLHSNGFAVALLDPAQAHAHGIEAHQNGPHLAHLPPTTFRMDNLLNEIHSMEGQRPHPAGGERWSEEFMNQAINFERVGGNEWTKEFFRGNHLEHPIASTSYNRTIPRPVMGPISMLRQSLHHPIYHDIAAHNVHNSQIPTAQEFLQNSSDSSIKATEFMNYIEKLSSGEIKFDETDAEHWSEEYFSNHLENPGMHQEYSTEEGNSAAAEAGKEEFWQKLQEEWERIAKDEPQTHPWLSENIHKNEEYKFVEENPFLNTLDPLEEGKRKLASGDIPAAVLLFEAAAQKYPDNPECWLLLGASQAQNEQDPIAIPALNKCLELQPDNLEALMSLAASYTNESFHLQACNTLKSWLSKNVKYSMINANTQDTHLMDNNASSGILPNSDLSNCQKMFIDAARMNPIQGVDPDVQCGLGILFNLGADYDKASDCFKSALSVRPEDSLLWNRLGATLANGGKSADAIGAYRRALELSPGFIRTRYNLGIACVNLGAYREAAEHFLSSLNLQSSGKSSQDSDKNNMSSSIWTSFRMILHLLDKTDLIHAIDSRNLEQLNQAFNIK